MAKKVFIFDPTQRDKLSSVRGIGRYLQIIKENFPAWIFTKNLSSRIYHLGSTFINPFFNFLKPPLTLKRLAPKQIAVIHDLIPLKYPSHFPAGIRGNINIFLNKLALKNYDLVVTDSEASKKDIIDILRLPNGKVKVVYPCLPKSFLKLKIKNLDLNKNSKFQIENFALYVGDATWNKNLVNLAKAIKIINVTCVFVGKVFGSLMMENRNSKLEFEGRKSMVENLFSTYEPQNQTSNFDSRSSNINHPWQKEFKEFLNEAKDDKRFIFAGFLPDSNLIKLYQQATVNVLPSRDEGFGFSFLEAAKFSCPSVLADIPVLREISDGNSLFVDPKNPQDIADKIGEIYFNKDVRNTLGKKAKKRSEFFSAEKFKESFLTIIEDRG